VARTGVGRLASPWPWLSAAVACLGVLGASGAWLSVRYRPYRPPPSGSRFRLPEHGGGWIADVHEVAALLFYGVVAGLVLTLLLRMVRRLLPMWVAVPIVAAVSATVVARVSGAPLPWAQLALWAVKANTDYRGVWRAAYDPSVRFVLTGVESSQAEYRLNVVAHIFAVPAVLAVALLGIAALLLRDRRAA
jgi:quinol-cytochrome oxidoreductase complex cytochrome b subunit